MPARGRRAPIGPTGAAPGEQRLDGGKAAIRDLGAALMAVVGVARRSPSFPELGLESLSTGVRR
jgi:hypothetical protein